MSNAKVRRRRRRRGLRRAKRVALKAHIEARAMLSKVFELLPGDYPYVYRLTGYPVFLTSPSVTR